MERNAREDLARHEAWTKYSKNYEAKAGIKINEIESGITLCILYHFALTQYAAHCLSDHLLSVLLDIPLINSESGQQKVPLLEIALEQNRTTFLNNEVLPPTALRLCHSDTHSLLCLQ